MKKYWIPFITSLLVAAVLFVGIKLGEARMANEIHVYQSDRNDFNKMSRGGLTSSEASAKLVYLFDLLRDRYVDTLDLQNLVEDAIPGQSWVRVWVLRANAMPSPPLSRNSTRILPTSRAKTCLPSPNNLKDRSVA